MRSSARCGALAALLTAVAVVPRAGDAQTPTPVVAARLTVRDLARLRWIAGDWRGTGTAGTTQAPFFERYRFENDSTLLVVSFDDSTWRTATDTTRYELRGGRLGNPGTGARWVATRLDGRGVDFAPAAKASNDFRWARGPGSGSLPSSWTATITPLKPGVQPRHYRMERVRR